MKPFVFSRQRILRLAEGFERDRRNALAAAVVRLSRAEDLLAELHRKRQELMEKRSNLLTRGADIVEVQDNYKGEVELDMRIEAQEKVIARCEEEVAKRREDLAERMRERKTYEKLRERAWERYRMDEGREEIRVVDDIATISLERIRAGEAGEIYEG